MRKIFIMFFSLLSILTLTACFGGDEFEVEYYGEDEVPAGRHIQVEDFDKTRRIKGYDEDKEEIIYYENIAALEEAEENGTHNDYIIYIYTTWCVYCTELKDVYGSLDLASSVEYENIYFINGDTLGTLGAISDEDDEDFSQFVYDKFYLEDEDRYLNENSEEDRGVISSINQTILMGALNAGKQFRTLDSISFPTMLRLKYTTAHKMGLVEVSGDAVDNYSALSIVRRFVCTDENFPNEDDKPEACAEGYEKED